MKKRNVILAAAGIYIGIAGGTQSLYAAESGEQVVESYEMGQQETSESDIPPVQDNTEADMDMLSPQENIVLDSDIGPEEEDYSESVGETEEDDLVLDGWQDIDGQRYYFVNNVKVTGEKRIGQYWYFFDLNTGAMKTGFYNTGNRQVYYAETGEMLFGEIKIDDNWYYFDKGNGSMKTGLQVVGSRVLYYADSGEMVKGEQIIDGKEYYFSYTNGARQSGIFSDNAGIMKYYLPEGGLGSGEISHEGSWYYFDEETYEMVTGHKQVGTRHLYYSETGEMVRGEVKIDGNWYYFHPSNGNMQTGFQNLGNRKVYYAESGEMLKGEQVIDGKVYFFSLSNGKQYVGPFTNEDGKILCYAPEGGYATGEICVDGNWYYFDKDTGEMVTGLATVGNRTVYYGENGIMVTGEMKLNGKWYYFQEGNGNMYKGFRKVGNRTVYYSATGEMASGVQTIGGNKYYFSPSNGNMLVSGWYNGEYYGSDGVCIGALAGKIEELKTYVTVPYVWGGTSPLGWDCSGFTQWALNYIGGVTIPRLSQDQALGGTYVDPYNMYAWQPGDVLCYSTGGTIGHTAVYLGDGMLMHALNENYGTLIQSVSYYESWDWGTTLVGVRRYL